MVKKIFSYVWSSGKTSQYFAKTANPIGSPNFSPNCTQRPIVLADLYNILFLTTNPRLGMEQDEQILPRENKCDMLYIYSSR